MLNLPSTKLSKNVYIATSKAALLDNPEPSGTFDLITASNEYLLPYKIKNNVTWYFWKQRFYLFKIPSNKATTPIM